MRRTHRVPFLTLMLIGWLGAAAAWAEVQFEPTPVTIASRETSVTIELSESGAPVSAHRIGSVRLTIDGHDYGHMVRVDRRAGVLRLTPTASMEIGTYQLEVSIGGRITSIPVYVTLEDEPTSLSSRAREQGLTEMDIRHQLGLYTEGRATVSIEMPEWFYLGKRIDLNMPTPANSSYHWYVNGELEDSGRGPHTFTFPLTTAGTYDFHYIETSPEGKLIESIAKTEAREESAVEIRTEPNRPVRLIGPPGYAGYTWLIESDFISEEIEFLHLFPDPGEYRVACIATGNEDIPDEAFRKVLFHVLVQSAPQR